MRTIQRAVSVAVTAAVLSTAGVWAYAADPAAAGVERTGTWLALGAAGIVALLAGLTAVFGPGGAERPASVPRRHFADDTGLQPRVHSGPVSSPTPARRALPDERRRR
ncbi:hypothetical protein GA0111570_102117 [Raineyella antarctica]|uniref:Uncharacterized protein n=1 Tax=Raineyella antarctica TaxID=1577474 RepID=A0A1G6GEJ8_9ACTN|nr:hypothetical protein [Raineyella antarctica]SDB80329.1 hypothetical protein GA0111570_102117 [Raineyella antarctica]